MTVDDRPTPAYREDDLARTKHLLGDVDPDLEASGTPAEGRGAAVRDQLHKLYAAARHIGTTLDLEVLAQRILATAIEHSGAERGALFYFSGDESSARLWAARGLEAPDLENAQSFSTTILREAHARRPVVTEDAAGDQRFAASRSVRLNEIRSVICVPIEAPDKVIGALYVDSLPSGRSFPPDATDFLGILAGLAGAAISNARHFDRVWLRAESLDRELSQLARFEGIVARSEVMEALLKQVRQVALTDFPVVLRGESGVGKELIARALHTRSKRRDGAFIVQNCAAIPAELIENEFFGHARGAFTGAHTRREGLFRLADGGTLVLDEVIDLHPSLQAKFLRVLEDGMVRPLGSSREEHVDFRLISSSGSSLEEAVDQGRFRRDLFYRLNVIELYIPPLRERPEDIPLLLEHFVGIHSDQVSGRSLRFADDALEVLMKSEWRGNVRELAHLVKRALVLVAGPVVHAADLDRLLPVAVARPSGATALPVGQMSLSEMEAEAVREALRRTGGNKLRAAKLLGVHRNNFLRRLNKIESVDAEGRRP